MRISLVPGPECIHTASGEIRKQRKRLCRKRGRQTRTESRIGAVERRTEVAPDFRATRCERRGERQKLHAASNRVAAILSAVWSPEYFDRPQVRLINQIEKRAYAPAHRRRRVAHAVDEHIYLVAGEPANEDAGDGWAG